MSRNIVSMLVLWLLAAVPQSGPKKNLAFDAKAYPPSKFKVSERDFPLGETIVRLIQVKNRGYTMEPSICRAWFEVRRGDRLLKRLYYADIDAVGFSYGIFVPKQQPLQDYFIAVKEGDYDGRLLLVASDGTLWNLPGGFYFLTDDKRYMIGEYATDGSSLTVVDVAQHKVVMDGQKDQGIPEILNWYRDAAGYFFTEPDPSSKSWPPPEAKGHVYRLDLEHLRIKRAVGDRTGQAGVHKVPYDFDPRKKQDCSSEPQ